MGQGQFNVEELKEIVEFSLQESLLDFQSFLELECGAVLRLVPADDSMSVQIVHETLQSYLVDLKRCLMPFWHVDETAAHSHILSICLKILCYQPVSSSVFLKQYAAENWDSHLTKINSESLSHDILIGLYQFFNSDGCKVWLEFGSVITY